MGSLLVLAPEAKALLSVPAQIKRAEQVVANLNKEYEVIKTQFDSMKATLEVVKKRFDDSNSTNLQLFDVLSVRQAISMLRAGFY
jgi:ribosomal protein L9